MKKKSSVYFRMFLSYICILVIPLALAMLLYGYTLSVIRKQSEKMNQNLLQMVQKELDEELDVAYKTSSRMALSDNVRVTAGVRGEFKPKDQMNLYYIYDECERVNLSEEFIEDIFVSFNNTQKVISSRGSMAISLFYDIYYKSDEFSQTEFLSYLDSFHYGDIISIHKTNGEKAFLYTMSVMNSDIKDHAATVCLEINFSAIKERLANMRWSEDMDVLLLTESGEVISSNEEHTGEPKISYANLEPGNSRLTDEMGETHIVSVQPSGQTDWKYASIMPVGAMEREARKVRNVMMVGLFACIVTGLSASHYITRKNYNPLKMLLENFKRHEDVEMSEDENEYQWLNNQMDEFFKKHVDAERLLKKNQKTLKNYYLNQLLLNPSAVKPSEQYRVNGNGEYSVVMLFIPLVSQTAEENSDSYIEENALQKFAIMNVFEEMCLEYFNVDMMELGERVAAIVNVPDESQDNQDILKGIAEKHQQMMEESFGFDCVILCSSICTDWSGIHAAYLQAVRLEEYINLLDTRLLFYDEVKEIQPQYNYPMEMEQKIINAIKVGDNKLACEVMEEVFENNLQSNVTANVYRCLVYGLVGTLVEGANQGGYKDVMGDIRFPDGSFSRQTIGETKDMFRNNLNEICFKVQEIQKEASKDRTLSKKVQEYIRENYQDQDLNISITSQHFGMTPSYLSSIYKKQTGGSLLEYINTVRINNAEMFLEQGYSVVEVAQMAGFRDSGTFIRVFKKKKGVTPGQLKKKG